MTLSAGFRLKFVEVDVLRDKDAKAQISYTRQWLGDNANFHGFYFERFSGTPVFDYENAYAVDQSGKRYNLDIKKLSTRKYDIILSEGQAFNNEQIT